MPNLGKLTLLPVALAAVFATSAAAQTECDVDQQTPTDLFRAFTALQAAQDPAAARDIAQNQLRQGVRFATGNTSANPLGRSLVLGKLLAWWLSLDGTPLVATRSQIGFATDANGQIDMIGAVDSLFNLVVRAAPQCADELRMYRQLRAWQNLVNRSIELMNADSVDAAEEAAKNALRLSTEFPYAHMVLGNAAAKRGRIREAIERYKQAIVESDKAAQKDTSYRDFKWSVYYNLGNLALDAAQDTTGPEKDFLLGEAKAAFDAALGAGGKTAEAAQSGLARVVMASGDSTALRNFFQQQIANPGNYTFSQLVQSGASAAEAEQNDIAIKLFEHAIAASPYHRDALFNLALLYIKTQRAAEAVPLIDRLVEVDPNGPENFRLYIFAYGDLRRPLTQLVPELEKRAGELTRPADAARRKLIADSAKALFDSNTMLVNLIVGANERADSLPARVIFTEYSPTPERATVAGIISNNTMAARSFTIKMEFLDKSGAVVGRGEAITETIPAKTCETDPSGSQQCRRSQAQFVITGTGAGITAFRYAEIK